MSNKTKYKSVLCKEGYIIRKDMYDPKLIRSIKKELTVKPFSPINFGKPPGKFEIYVENNKKLCLPRRYALKKLGPPEKVDIHPGKNINVKFAGQLREYQKKIVEVLLEKIYDKGGGILCIPPGRGKTCIGIYLGTVLKKKMLVIVHKTFLVDQWIDRIGKFAPSAKIGRIQADVIDVHGKDIVIGMLQSLSMKEYDNELFDEFGLVIVDECHHINSRVFSKALPKVASKYMLGLSATPERNDKLEKVFEWHVGEIIYHEPPKVNTNVKVHIYRYKIDHEGYKEVINNYTQTVQIATMITNITQIPERNNFIVGLIDDIKTAEARKILILSDRKEHLNVIKKKIDDLGKYSTGYYVGGMKKKKLKESEGKEIIFATYAMSSEGLDIEALDTVMLVTPRANVTQSVGRILRKEADKYMIQPLIIDIVDQPRVFTNQGYKRRRLYKKTKYDIDIFDVVENVIKPAKMRGTSKKKKVSKSSSSDDENKCLFVDSD